MVERLEIDEELLKGEQYGSLGWVMHQGTGFIRVGKLSRVLRRVLDGRWLP